MKNKTKTLDREQVVKFNRNLTKVLNDIEYQLYDLGADYYSLEDAEYDGVDNRVKDLAKAMHALKKELYKISKPQNKGV